MQNNVLFAFLVTLFAGLATSVGSVIGLYTKKNNYAFLSASLGFSAGVMLYVSFIEIYPQALKTISASFNNKTATIITTLAFFAGIALIAVIDHFVPSDSNPHEIQNLQNINNPPQKQQSGLMRMGLFSALAIGIHNFPEGIATFIGALQDPQLGLSIGVAIAIHNIPEGIAVSVPIYFATGNKKKAFVYSFLSGFAEPLGAIVGYFLLMPFLSATLMGVVFAITAGIMVYISLDELLPTARKYEQFHTAIIGTVAGMAVMALSLILI